MVYDLICIGSGAAGLSAAIYAGRYRMNVLVIGDQFGGYTSIAGVIENYPGYVEVDGYELMLTMKKQAEKTGAEILESRVESVSKEGDVFVITTKDKEFRAYTVLFGMGNKRRQLGLAREDELTSKGVHYCITCDAPLYRDKTIAVVGGGDASVKGLTEAAAHAKKVYLLVRGTKLRAEPLNIQRMMTLGDRLEILYETEVTELLGDKKFEGIKISKPYNGSDMLTLDGLFIEIGSEPRTELAASLGVELDPLKFIIADPMTRTNIPGVFAAGDIVNLFGTFKQDITAAALGAVAATSAYEYCQTHGDLCKRHAQVNGE